MNWNWVSIVVFGSFIAVGLGAMLTGLRQIWLAYVSRRWTTAYGEITCSEVGISSDSEGTTYRPIVKFTYCHQGQDFTGDTIFWGGGDISITGRGYADKFVQKYPVGKTVTVYYNPKNPSQSVLEAGLTKKSFILFTFGSVFFIMGVGLMASFSHFIKFPVYIVPYFVFVFFGCFGFLFWLFY